MWNRNIVLLFLLLLSVRFAWAQEDRVNFRIHYVINIAEIDTAFVDNTARISDLRSFLRMLQNDSTIQVKGVKFRGTASPDGGYEFNQWLCVNRLRTFKELVRSYIDLPDSIIKANVSDIPWDGFREKVAESDLEYRDEILAIIDEGPSLVPWFNGRHIDPRLLKLKRLHKGKVWETLKSPILEDLRFGNAIFEIYRPFPKQALPEIPELTFEPFSFPEWPDVDTWTPRLHLKTNFIALCMLIADFGVEADLCPHWSVALPVTFSGGIDYFISTIKFRNFTVQPEVRYWFRSDSNEGWFTGAHLKMAYYNFAFDGDYRYQDYRGRTPAFGGGLSLGYRKSLSQNRRWWMEFTAGAGIYPLHYDMFYNTPDVKDGQLYDTRKKTYVGLDQAAVTLSYSFDMKKYQRTYPKKKGGK